jgi:hypothetical protein
MGCTALIGGYAANNIGTVFDHLHSVESAFRTGKALHQYFGLFIH